MIFEQDIKPLFRPVDHESMAWAFDLSSYDEVKEHATAILERLRNGSMPCDGEWLQEQVERFQRWTETGMRGERLLLWCGFLEVVPVRDHAGMRLPTRH